MTNLKFSFSESGPGSVPILPKPIFLFLSFQTFKGTLKMLQITFCPQFQQEKSLKWPLSLNHLGYAAEIFGILCSQWDYQMVNISSIFKSLTWHRFDEFGPMYIFSFLPLSFYFPFTQAERFKNFRNIIFQNVFSTKYKISAKKWSWLTKGLTSQVIFPHMIFPEYIEQTNFCSNQLSN